MSQSETASVYFARAFQGDFLVLKSTEVYIVRHVGGGYLHYVAPLNMWVYTTLFLMASRVDRVMAERVAADNDGCFAQAL